MILKTAPKNVILCLLSVCLCSEIKPISLDIQQLQPHVGSLAAITAGAGTGLLAYNYLIKGFFGNQGPSRQDIQQQIATISRAVTKKTAEYTALQEHIKQATTVQEKKALELNLKKLDAYFTRAEAKLADLNNLLIATELNPSTSKQSIASWTALCVCVGAGAYAGYRIHQFWGAQQQSAPEVAPIVTLQPVTILDVTPDVDTLDTIDTSTLQLPSDYNAGDTDLLEFLNARDITENVTELYSPELITATQASHIMQRMKHERKQAASAAKSIGTLVAGPSDMSCLLSNHEDLTQIHLEYITQSSRPIQWSSIDLTDDQLYFDLQGLAVDSIHSERWEIELNCDRALHEDNMVLESTYNQPKSTTLAEKLWGIWNGLLKNTISTTKYNQIDTIAPLINLA